MPAHGVHGGTHETQILIHRQIDKNVLAFGNQRQAAGHPLMRRQAFNGLSFETDLACYGVAAARPAGKRVDQRGLAGAVGTD